MKKKYKKVALIVSSFLFFLCVAFFLGQFFLNSQWYRQKNNTIADYAHEVVKKCADAPSHAECYETEVPKLVSYLPTDKIFDVIRAIRVEDPQYLYCHVLAHKLGEYEVSLDPNNWLDVIAKGPSDGMCSNGFVHGASIARFHTDNLSKDDFDTALKDLSIACEERAGYAPTDLTKAICYHGIGHVLVYMTQANVKQSLDACEVISKKDDGRSYIKLCTEGVYMQLFQPLEPEDFALIDKLPYKPTSENIKKFCTEFSSNDFQYGACWRESWPLLGPAIYDAKGITDYCMALTPSQDRESCFISAFTINGRHGLGDPEKMTTLCNNVTSEYQGECFARSANAFLEEDPQFVKKGVAFCATANNLDAQNQCYSFLANISAFNFHKGSVPYEDLCSSLPSQFEKICRGQ